MTFTLRPWMAVVALIGLAFATRYYLLAPETGDIDEATFMVVAQSVLRGALPYELALDNKPAGFFYVLAGVMVLFGQSLEAVRLFGSALVATTALVLWLLCRRYLSLAMATALAALFVVAQAGSIGDSTKSELVANLFVAGSLLVLVALRRRNLGSFFAGLLLGCAVLMRTNLAYLALTVALLHLAALFRPGIAGLKRGGILALAVGGLLPLGVLLLPYALRGELQLLWLGAVEIAWSQAQGSRDALARLILLPHSFVRILPSLAGLLVVLCGVGIWRTRAILRQRPELRRDVLLGWLYLAAIEFSIIMSGAFFNHYMLQVLPPLMLLGAIGFSGSEWNLRQWVPRFIAAGVLGGLAWFGGLGIVVAWQQIHGELDRPLRRAATAMADELREEDRGVGNRPHAAHLLRPRQGPHPSGRGLSLEPRQGSDRTPAGPRRADARGWPARRVCAAAALGDHDQGGGAAPVGRSRSQALRRAVRGVAHRQRGGRLSPDRGGVTMIPPTLRTARLTLRPMREADFPAYLELMASPRSVYMGGPYDLRGAWGAFCHDIACWTLYGHGGLMIDLTATGETVGQIGINGGPLFPEKELGWLVYAGFEGRGYVTEAAAAMRDWAFGALGVDSLVSYMDPDNRRSAAVAERLGAMRDTAATTQVQDPGDVVYRHYRPHRGPVA